MTYAHKIIILFICVSLFLIGSVSANDTKYSPVPTIVPTIDAPNFDPQTDEYMRYWWDGSLSNELMSPFGFLYSFIHVFDKFFGAWFFVICFGIWIYTVWTRSRGTELIVVGIMATGGIWGYLLPGETFQFFTLILAMGIAAILFRLFKSKS